MSSISRTQGIVSRRVAVQPVSVIDQLIRCPGTYPRISGRLCSVWQPTFPRMEGSVRRGGGPHPRFLLAVPIFWFAAQCPDPGFLQEQAGRCISALVGGGG